MRPIAATVMGLALAWSAAASAWETQVSTEYRIGDSESRVMAKENAYQALKVEAAGEAKTYIQGTETLSDGELSETIKVMGASLVELDDVETSFSLSDDSTQVMSVTGTASVDESVLKERMRQIQQDKSKQKAIERLSDKNDQLRQRIETLRRQQKSVSNDAAMAENLESQAETYREIQKLNNSVTDVFERGTLLNMANQSNSQLERVKELFRENVFQPLVDADVEATIDRVTQKGDVYKAEVIVTYAPDILEITGFLKNHLGVGRSSDGTVSVDYLDNEKGEGPKNYSPDIFVWLAKQDVQLEIRVGNKAQRYYVAHRSEFSVFDGCGDRLREVGSSDLEHSQYCILRLLKSDDHRLPDDDGDYGQNPFVIYLNEEQAANANQVTAKVIYDGTQ